MADATPRTDRSGPGGVRERKKEKTRDALARAALRLFDERGYANVTVDEIVEECGASPRTFFRYFGAKDDALFAEGEARRAGLLAALEAQPAAASPFEAIYGASMAVADRYERERQLLLARDRIMRSTPALQTRDAELPHRWDREIRDVLRRSGRAADASDLELRLVVGAAMTALRVAIEAWLAAADADLAKLIDATFQRLRDGLGD